MLDSSFATRSTQSKSSPTGSASRIATARWRTRGSNRSRFAAEATGATTLRWGACFGASEAMNIGSGKSSSALAMVIAGLDENDSWSVLTATMSSKRVIDQ